PVHPHHRAERLEPEAVGKPAQQLVAAIFVDDRLGDHRAQPGYAIAKPFGHAAAMERKVRAAGAVRHQGPPASGTAATVSAPCAIAASPAKRGSSVATPAGGSSKLETVTP